MKKKKRFSINNVGRKQKAKNLQKIKKEELIIKLPKNTIKFDDQKATVQKLYQELNSKQQETLKKIYSYRAVDEIYKRSFFYLFSKYLKARGKNKQNQKQSKPSPKVTE